MRTVDSSVTVAAFATWHEHHEVAHAAVTGGPLLAAHVALETYAVLTRLPPPHRVSGVAVRQFLDTNFPTPWLFLDGRRYQSLVGELAASGVVGGAVYDALVAATALDVDATLVSADGRARSVYEAIGTVVEMIV